MIWCSGWELASAVSNAGGLGLIGSGSMSPDVLRLHIEKLKEATNKPFGVNVPLIYQQVDEIMKVILDERIKIVFTSAGNPKTWTKILKDNGSKVAHVIANKKFALKCKEADVDAIVAEGFEAGGHNGREETTSLVLVPLIKEAVDLPLIAAGGIANGKAMLATMILGADGVQLGTRFVASEESSAHENFKKEILKLKDGDTKLSLRKLIPVRLIMNRFYEHISTLESQGASVTKLVELLGKGKSKKGMFEGDIEQGELEIGEVSSIIHEILPAQQIINSIVNEYNTLVKEISTYKL